MEKTNVKLLKVIFILATTAIAIIIFSLTAGKEIYEGRGQSLASFGLVHFSGYLFFFLMPVEMAFIYYLSFYNHLVLIAVAMITAVLAQLIDYFIGYSFSTGIINNLVGEKKIVNAEKQISRYGNITIFVFNLLPLSSPIIALVGGMLKFRFKDMMLYSMTGLLIKYILLSLIF